MKKPWLAALLNLIPLGFGYIYLRRWRRFTATFIGGLMFVFAFPSVLALALHFTCAGDYVCSDSELGAMLILPLLFALAVAALLGGLTAWDAWHLRHQEDTRAMKKPWLAAVLNVIPFPGFGAGYAYLDRDGRMLGSFAGLWVALLLGVGLAVIIDVNFYGASDGLVFIVLVSPLLVLAALTAWDAHRLARKHNEQVAATANPPATDPDPQLSV